MYDSLIPHIQDLAEIIKSGEVLGVENPEEKVSSSISQSSTPYALYHKLNNISLHL